MVNLPPFLDCFDPSLAHHGQHQGQRAGGPAVIGKPAETALVGDHPQQADAKIPHHCRHDHTHQINRHVGPDDLTLQSILQAEDIGPQDGGDGQQEGKPHGKFPLKAHKAPGGDGGAGTGDAGTGGDGLPNAHQQHIHQRGVFLRFAALADPVAGKEQQSGKHQGACHEVEIITQALHQIFHRQHRKEGQRAHDDQQNQTSGRGHGIGGGSMGQIPDPGEKLHHHLPDILPVGNKHGDEGAQVQQHIVKIRHIDGTRGQQMLRNGQMAGAGNGQKLRYALDQAQQDGR